MTGEEAYAAWAPGESLWSPWAKPVLFAHVGGLITPPDALPQVDVSWAPPADGSTVLVLDLPGPAGAIYGIALATIGYRPVPLYNACPAPAGLKPQKPGDPICAVDLAPVVEALEAGAPVLRSLHLPPHAPPAFLLDAHRRVGSVHRVTPGMFDNRSVSLPTDFPSANLMLGRGVQRVLLVQESTTTPQEDLAHTLLRWQQAGIAIESLALAGPHPSRAQRILVNRPRWYRIMFQRLLATARLRRHPLGGFGGVLPIPSKGGRGYRGGFG